VLYKDQHRQAGARLLDSYYFAENVSNTAKKIWCHLRMNNEMCMQLVFGVEEYDDNFMCKKGCTGLWGVLIDLEMHGCPAVYSYGAPLNTANDYLRMSKTTCFDSIYKFCQTIVTVFGPTYLREPNEKDTAQNLAQNAARGFPSMLQSIVWMHWAWKIVHLL
jgi:hypothetical protein